MNHEPSISIPDVASPAAEPQAGAARCQYRTRTGRRCRQLVSGHVSGFCPKHAERRPSAFPQTDFSELLTAEIAEFASAQDVHQVLSRLLVVLAQDRISTRRAAVIAYISSLLLRTVSAVQRETPVEFILDTPRPIHDAEPQLEVRPS